MEFDLKELVNFARENHEQFKNFSQDSITKFFEVYAKNVIVRQDQTANKINGFAVILRTGPKKIDVVTVCLTGSRENNRRDMLAFINRWESAEFEITWQRNTTGDNVFGLLADVYDSVAAG